MSSGKYSFHSQLIQSLATQQAEIGNSSPGLVLETFPLKANVNGHHLDLASFTVMSGAAIYAHNFYIQNYIVQLFSL
jgi:hypothetical protein